MRFALPPSKAEMRLCSSALPSARATESIHEPFRNRDGQDDVISLGNLIVLFLFHIVDDVKTPS